MPPPITPLPVKSTGTLGCFLARFLGHLSIPLARFPRFFRSGCGLYPEGKGSDSIRRTIAPNSRRVRWLSAKKSQ